MKIAKGDQVTMQELIDTTGTDSGNVYLSLFEQPLYIDGKFETVTVEIITKDDNGRLLGAVRGKDDAGNHKFTNVLYHTREAVWKVNHLMNDMIVEIERQKQGI